MWENLASQTGAHNVQVTSRKPWLVQFWVAKLCALQGEALRRSSFMRDRPRTQHTFHGIVSEDSVINGGLRHMAEEPVGAGPCALSPDRNSLRKTDGKEDERAKEGKQERKGGRKADRAKEREGVGLRDPPPLDLRPRLAAPWDPPNGEVVKPNMSLCTRMGHRGSRGHTGGFPQVHIAL